jgi:exonuclease III
MRIITWNVRRATETSDAWRILTDLKPDIALLQEVASIPKDINKLFDIKFNRAIGKTGKLQQFSTAILVKGKIVNELPLRSEYDWVNRELEYFAGNLVSCVVQPTGYPILNIVSVYSPAWPIDISKYPGVDITTVKLKQNPKLWVTEILWSALKNANLVDAPWIVGGDFNSSETFDLTFSSGNREILDRMESLGFTECLRKYNDKLTPTFRNLHGGKVVHQIDHLFVTDLLSSMLGKCITGDEVTIFGESVSDHLPIISDFKDVYTLPPTKNS